MIVAPIATLVLVLPANFSQKAGGFGAHVWALHGLASALLTTFALWRQRGKLRRSDLQLEAAGIANMALSLGLFSGYLAAAHWQAFMTYGSVDTIIIGVLFWRLAQIYDLLVRASGVRRR